MSDFTVFRNKNFASIPTYHLRDHSLSLKAVGLLTKMLLLPPEWDYSLNGLVAICKEGRDVIKNTLSELKRHGYVEINEYRNQKGQIQYKYIVHRKSLLEERKNDFLPLTEKPSTVEPMTVNQLQLNNNKLNDKIDKTKSEDFDHNEFTKKLINYEFIKEDDYSSFLFDDLFNKYLEDGYSKRELMMSINYIIPRIISNNYLDEFGNEIVNKYGYFKNAIESNFNKLNNLDKELYSLSDIEKTLSENGGR